MVPRKLRLYLLRTVTREYNHFQLTAGWCTLCVRPHTLMTPAGVLDRGKKPCAAQTAFSSTSDMLCRLLGRLSAVKVFLGAAALLLLPLCLPSVMSRPFMLDRCCTRLARHHRKARTA